MCVFFFKFFNMRLVIVEFVSLSNTVYKYCSASDFPKYVSCIKATPSNIFTHDITPLYTCSCPARRGQFSGKTKGGAGSLVTRL